MKRSTLRQFLFVSLMLMTETTTWAQSTSVSLPTADTWVSEKYTTSYGTKNTLEVRTSSSESAYYYGLISFQFTKPNVGYRVKSATLRLVTRYKKGDSSTSLYAFGGDFTESSVYTDVASDVTTALGQPPVATFKANGDRTYAPTDGGISSTYTTASAWQNFIDVTSYVRSLSSNSFSLLVAKDYDQANSTQFFTKEVTDLTNTTYGVTFAQADLQPQLTVEYEADPNQVTSTATSTGDTYLRMGNTVKRGTETTMEVLTDLANSKDFVGLLRFALPTEVTSGEYTVQQATLRLVTERCKGVTSMSLYPYGHDFSEDAIYADETSYVDAAREETPVTFNVAFGVRSKSLVLDDISANPDLSAWTNTIDVTSLAKSATTPAINLLLASADGNANSNKFFTKETGDVTNAINTSYTYAAADLVPQLTVLCTKAGTDNTYLLTITSGGASTLIIPFDAALPEGVKAYTLAYAAGSSHVTATEVSSITANQPVLVNVPAGDYTFTATGNVSTKTTSSYGALTGVYTSVTAPMDSYVLQNQSAGLAFYKVASSDISVGAYRAYLTASASAGAKLSIVYGGETTGIDTLPVESGSETVDTPIYNLAGQRVSKGYKGVVIINGKKYINR